MSRWLLGRLVADRVLALVLGVLSAPVVALLAVAARLADGERGLITVPRAGRHGRPFAMGKVRTMRADGPGGRASGSSLTGVEDPRITPLGRRLRSLHLDELPQLWSVVRGDMALFGPRPEAPDLVDVDDPAWQAVLVVPPGIAGPTQLVVGDYERSQLATGGTDAYRRDVLPVKLAVDRWYVERATPALDLLVARSLVAHSLGRPVPTLLRRVRSEVPEARVLASEQDVS